MGNSRDATIQSVSVLGRVLQHVASTCEVMSITHCRGLGTSVSVEFDDPETRKRMAGLVSVRPAQRQNVPIVAISIGLQDFSVSSAEETDCLPAFRDRISFLECFRSPRAA